MIDPHVVSLLYELQDVDGRLYQNAPPVALTKPTYTGQLDSDIFVATLATHFATAAAARAIVEPDLRAWAIAAGVRGFRIQFRFKSANVVDWAPAIPSTVQISGVASISMTGTATASVINHAYPAPPINFCATPVVDALWQRYCRFRDQRESLYAAAYWCLTELEDRRSHPGIKGKPLRRIAAAQYQVEFAVLDAIGTLSSERGSPLEARKSGTTIATAEEDFWLEAAIKALIQHIGTRAAGQGSAPLALADLPPLSAI